MNTLKELVFPKKFEVVGVATCVGKEVDTPENPVLNGRGLLAGLLRVSLNTLKVLLFPNKFGVVGVET